MFLFAAPISAFFKMHHKHLWLICEDGTMARDNGYWLFKYIREHHQETDAAFAITKQSPDIEKEQDFVEKTFGYEGRNIVKMLGLARFDNLMNFRSVYKANQILLMPTWRDWLGSAALHLSLSEFMESEYYKVYESFIKSPLLHSFLRENNLKLLFFPHKGMQKFISAFNTDCPNVIITYWRKYDVQTLLMESAFCITDYSSIAMDFAYMEKPLVYYQFD